jgi:hypothetical protein
LYLVSVLNSKGVAVTEYGTPSTSNSNLCSAMIFSFTPTNKIPNSFCSRNLLYPGYLYRHK